MPKQCVHQIGKQAGSTRGAAAIEQATHNFGNGYGRLRGTSDEEAGDTDDDAIPAAVSRNFAAEAAISTDAALLARPLNPAASSPTTTCVIGAIAPPPSKIWSMSQGIVNQQECRKINAPLRCLQQASASCVRPLFRLLVPQRKVQALGPACASPHGAQIVADWRRSTQYQPAFDCSNTGPSHKGFHPDLALSCSKEASHLQRAGNAHHFLKKGSDVDSLDALANDRQGPTRSVADRRNVNRRSSSLHALHARCQPVLDCCATALG